MAHQNEKTEQETSSNFNENSDSDLEESTNHKSNQSINQEKYVHHEQKARLPKPSYSSESDNNDFKNKSYKSFKACATGVSYQCHKPKCYKKTNKRSKKRYYHSRESDSSDMNEDASNNLYGPDQHTSKKSLINSKHENSPINSNSLINSLSMCPNFSESLLNLAEHEDILPKYVRKIVNDNPHMFTLSDNIVTLSPKISICSQHLNEGCSKPSICHDLHICQQFVINNCKDSRCILGHTLTSNHNKNALRQFKIQKLSADTLLNILKTQISPAKPLKVCNKYNLGRCKRLRCDSLHVCIDLVQNKYRCKLNNCNLNHDLLDDACIQLLATAGVTTNEAPRDVLAALWESNPQLCETQSEERDQEKSESNPSLCESSSDNRDQEILESNHLLCEISSEDRDKEKLESNPVLSNTSSEDTDQEKSKENSVQQKNTNETHINALDNDASAYTPDIITLPNTNLECETSNNPLGNQGSHNESADILSDSEFELLFQWQVSSDGSQWVNMYHSEALRIEQAFCDPKNETVTLSKLICPNIKSDRNDIDFLMGNNFWEANFQSMLLLKDDQSDILYLRRQNVDFQPSQSHESIIFLWFFEDSDGKWLESSQDSDRENKLFISVSSNEIEQMYLKDPNIPFTLGNSNVSYILDFESMTLLNLQNNKNINVRRRPKSHLKNVTLSDQGEMGILFNMAQNSNGNLDHFSNVSNFSELNTIDDNYSENLGDNIQNSVISQKYTVCTWSHNPEGYVEIPEICYDSVVHICKNERSGCKRLHAKLHFHWQVSEDGAQWINMHPSHVLSLERAFCNPVNDEVSIPLLDQASLGYEESGSLIALGTDTWRANFQSMLLLNNEQTRILYLRRLTTESIAGQCIEANLYLWYIEHADEKWVQLGRDCINNFSIDVRSTTVEGNFQHDSSSSMTLGNSSWVLDFNSMTLSNSETDIRYDVKRRPKPHLKVSGKDINLNEQGEIKDQIQSLPHSISTISLPNTWDAMLPGEKSCRIPLSQLSTEFATVQDILPDSLQTKITNIERIQNPFLWYAFQNKIREMSATYEGDASKVNVMQLFHGTTPDIIENICTENFDWRLLLGSHTGQVYGCGTYFSTDATISYRYCTSDSSGKLYLLLAQVAVGMVTLGDSTMLHPPVNAETGLPYDSTVNNLSNPTIIVKYDKHEYFPEYIITIG